MVIGIEGKLNWQITSQFIGKNNMLRPYAYVNIISFRTNTQVSFFVERFFSATFSGSLLTLATKTDFPRNWLPLVK